MTDPLNLEPVELKLFGDLEPEINFKQTFLCSPFGGC